MRRRARALSFPVLVIAFFFLLAACVETTRVSEADDDVSSPEPTATDIADEAEDAETADGPDADEEPTAEPAETPEPRMPGWTRNWENTDLDNRTVELTEIISGGVPRDGIPPIDNPVYVGFDDADDWLEPQEPVILFEIEGDARAYPLQIMTWHEIVNTEFDDLHVAVTFCPLCNSALAFDRDVEGVGLVRFGVSGLLRKSDLIMWDDKTETLWQQLTGEAIVGELAGTQLTLLPLAMISYEEFKRIHPDGVVLSQETGHSRPYGNNPYVGYDDINSSPFMLREIADDTLPPMMRVLALEINDEAIAYPFSELAEHPVVNDEVGGEPVVVFWQPGATSALDQTSIAGSQDVGMAAAFNPTLDGERLTFAYDDGAFRDAETGSVWNIAGIAESGELEGSRLDEYVSGAHFWFAWAAFRPETAIWSP